LGYWLGRRYGKASVERYARWLLKPGRVVIAESFVRRYGALAVCVGRFVGGVPFLGRPFAGAVGPPFRSFFSRDFPGAVLFVPYAVGIGYAIGYGLGPYMTHLQHTLGGIGHLVLLLAIIMVVVLAAWRTIIRTVRVGVMHALLRRLRRRHDPST